MKHWQLLFIVENKKRSSCLDVCGGAAGLAAAPVPEHPPTVAFPTCTWNIFPARRSVQSADSNPSGSVPSGHGCHLRLARRK